jgi:hypothetical protein
VDNEQLIDRVQTMLFGMEERIGVRFDRIDRRLEGIEHRLEGIERRLGTVETRLDSIARGGHAALLVPFIRAGKPPNLS